MYILFICILTAVYGLVIYLMKYMTNTRILNFIFSMMIFLPYVTCSLIIYSDVGFYDWNYRNTLPTANVSPFVFSIIPVIMILPRKLKKYGLTLISLLSVGMLLSTILGCIFNAIRNYTLHFHFTLDYIAHYSTSLFGIYLIRSDQVDLKRKNILGAAIIIFGWVTLMTIHNAIFDTSFFGLSLNGKHNIYNVVLTENSYISAILYFIGLSAVLIIGWVSSKLIKRFSKIKARH